MLASEVRIMFVKAVFFFMVGVILASLFAWIAIQGVRVHLSGDAASAYTYYFVAWLSGIAAFILYHQARATFHYAKIST